MIKILHVKKSLLKSNLEKELTFRLELKDLTISTRNRTVFKLSKVETVVLNGGDQQ
jgi:hypothetical protein